MVAVMIMVVMKVLVSTMLIAVVWFMAAVDNLMCFQYHLWLLVF